MRILFTIPHFYDSKGGGMYGSLKPDSRPRRNSLATAILGLHANVGAKQGLLVNPVVLANTACKADIDVVVCTTGNSHLIKDLNLPEGLYHHHATTASPRLLGFECHKILREGLGKYDYFCFLEDDLLITDPLFFVKLAWFTSFAGNDAVLQPNRFEVAAGPPYHKLYIDGNLKDPTFSERLQNVKEQPVLTAETLGTEMKFQRVNNPHSGCFFFNARQMAQWAGRPEFLNRDISFVGPLESAATFAAMHFFRAYKPARENSGFLEIRHLDNRYLGVRIKPSMPTEKR